MGESCPKLLDLIPNERKWSLNREDSEKQRRNGSSSSDENNKLELRLGLPGDEIGWSVRERNESLLSLNYHNHPFLLHHHYDHQNHLVRKESPSSSSSSQLPCCSRIVKLQNPPSANTAVPNTSQKRAAPAPVVGWPPIRSFRKNLANSSSTKPVSDPQDPNTTKPVNEKPAIENSNSNSHKGLFVKINMDGVPIGRKVDLNAYDSYDNLSSAVDNLFRGLLAAQREGTEIEKKEEEQKPISGLMDGSGEYTLVYEDNEGDRMLVGDVPWKMFVSTVKRLRVLKSSDLPTLGCSSK